MNRKRYESIKNWLHNGPNNKEWEAYLAVKQIIKWKYSSYSLHEIQAFVTIRDNGNEKFLVDT